MSFLRQKIQKKIILFSKKDYTFFKKSLTKCHPDAILFKQFADVAELADAHDSGSCEITLIGVQVPSSASNYKRS